MCTANGDRRRIAERPEVRPRISFIQAWSAVHAKKPFCDQVLQHD